MKKMDILLQNGLKHYFRVYQANNEDLIAPLTAEQQEELTEQLHLLRQAIFARLSRPEL